MKIWKVTLAGTIDEHFVEVGSAVEAPTAEAAADRAIRNLEGSKITDLRLRTVDPVGGGSGVSRRRPVGRDDSRRQRPGQDPRRQEGGGQ